MIDIYLIILWSNLACKWLNQRILRCQQHVENYSFILGCNSIVADMPQKGVQRKLNTGLSLFIKNLLSCVPIVTYCTGGKPLSFSYNIQGQPSNF